MTGDEGLKKAVVVVEGGLSQHMKVRIRELMDWRERRGRRRTLREVTEKVNVTSSSIYHLSHGALICGRTLIWTCM